MKWLFLTILLISKPIYAIPVVPNFTTGQSSSTTRTQTNITETIRTTDFNSGFTYSVSGAGVTATGDSISPSNATVQQTINGTTYTWTGADLKTKPNWQLTTQGGAFQFTEVYQQPSMSRITDLTRTIQSESVTETTTIFSQ